MSSFSYNTQHLVHSSGSKDYHIFLITNRSSRRTLMIRRWGKVRTYGSIRVQEFYSLSQAESYSSKIISSKCTPKHGYSLVSKSDTAFDAGSLSDIISAAALAQNVTDHLRYINMPTATFFTKGAVDVTSVEEFTEPQPSVENERIKLIREIAKTLPSYGSW